LEIHRDTLPRHQLHDWEIPQTAAGFVGKIIEVFLGGISAMELITRGYNVGPPR